MQRYEVPGPESPAVNKRLKRNILSAFIIILMFVNMGCMDTQEAASPSNTTAFTNLLDITVILYVDGKIETQIFPSTTYWMELADGHHTYAVTDKETKQQEIMNGQFLPGEKINIYKKS